jgi:plasmid stabilization system protein ParE
MSYNIIFKEEAVNDVSDAWRWYESRQKGLGNKLLNEIEEYIKILEREPQLYQIRENRMQYCPLKKFPYIIVYEIEDLQVVIFALFNTHMHPLRLIKRKGEE